MCCVCVLLLQTLRFYAASSDSQNVLANSSKLELQLTLLLSKLMDEALGKRIDKCLTVPDLLIQLDPWGIVNVMMKLVDAVRWLS